SKRIIGMVKLIKERASTARGDRPPSDHEEVYDTVPAPDDSPGADEPVIQDVTDVAYSFDTQESDNQAENESEAGEAIQTAEAANKTNDDNPLPMTEAENHEYELPSPHLLAEPTQSSQQQEKSQIQATVRKLERTFNSFGVKARVTK